MKVFKYFFIFFIFLFMFGTSSAVYAQESQEINIQKIDIDQFPEIDAFLNFPTGSELGALDLDEKNFKVLENGQDVEGLSVTRVAQIEEPIGVVLVVDTSGSMEGEPIEDAKNAASVFMDEMRPIDEFSIVGFADDVKVYSDFTSRRLILRQNLESMAAEGETSLFDGIIIASNQFNRREDLRYRYIIVLSDGTDTVSKLGAGQAIEEVKQSGAVVYSVVLESYDFNPEDLRSISSATRGELLVAAGSSELEGLYREISRKIRNQYKISYTSLWPNTEQIEVEVRVGQSNLEGVAHTEYSNPYYAPPPTEVIVERPSAFLSFFKIWWVKLIIYAAIFLGASLFLYILAVLVLPSGKLLDKRTEFYGYKPKAKSTIDEDMEGESRLGRGRLVKLVQRLASKRGFIEFFDLKLERAGMSIRASEFITLHIIAVVIATLGIYVLSSNILITILIVVIIIFLPFLILNYKSEKRLQKFNQQLPDTLQLISGSLKAGYSFNQSLSMVVDETAPPISSEFKKVLSEIRMGLPEKEALGNMLSRIGTEHLKWVVMAVNIQREVGGNLVEVLETISKTIRERDAVLRQIKALTAEGKLSAIILIALPILVGAFITITNREYISLLITNPLGLVMIGVSVLLMIIGTVWIVKVIKVEY
ncbi:MAG: type II secretion system F family protein [Actinomycetia bacterium]|nr:type II secretion system F family protein [Actinomycetes bacterium]